MSEKYLHDTLSYNKQNTQIKKILIMHWKASNTLCLVPIKFIKVSIQKTKIGYFSLTLIEQNFQKQETKFNFYWKSEC